MSAALLTSTYCISARGALAPARDARRARAAPSPAVAISNQGRAGFAPAPAPAVRRAGRCSAASLKAGMISGEVDDEAMLEKAGFPIAPEELITKCKAFLATNNGTENPDLLDESFVIVAPVIGPLPKQIFLDVFGGFGIKDAFSDCSEQYHNFYVDPFEGNRVWFMSRFKGTHDGTFINMEPTGKVVELVPTMSSVIFNEKGLVTKLCAETLKPKPQVSPHGVPHRQRPKP